MPVIYGSVKIAQKVNRFARVTNLSFKQIALITKYL